MEFDGCVFQLSFEEDLRISSMFSGEGECVPFSNSLYPSGNVEDWLLEVENTMRGSLREILRRALLEYAEVKFLFSKGVLPLIDESDKCFFCFAFALKSLAQHNPFPSSKYSDFQTTLSAKPLLGKLFLLLIFISMASHLAYLTWK